MKIKARFEVIVVHEKTALFDTFSKRKFYCTLGKFTFSSKRNTAA